MEFVKWGYGTGMTIKGTEQELKSLNVILAETLKGFEGYKKNWDFIDGTIYECELKE